MKKLICLSAALLVFAISATTSLAQGTTSRLTGVVQDKNGASVAGANVTLSNDGNGISLTTETSDSGTYTFDLIQVGSYTVTVEKQGFKKFLSAHNMVNVNQPTTVNAALEVGDVNEVVQVTAAQETVQTSTSGNIGTTIEQRELTDLPIVTTRGRNPLDLLNVQPGVVFGGNTGGSVNVHGSRDRAFNFTLDGIDINESTAGGSNFTPLRPNPDSISQVQIVTSNFTAELGRSSGAQVSMITRSGTNEFHGTGFEFYRTPRLDAKAYTNTINNTPKDQFVQHIFGGSLGGPIVKNKLLFFTNLQLLRAYDTALVARTVYTANARAGLFRYVVGRANAPAGTSTAAVNTTGGAILPACTGTPPTNSPCISSYDISGAPGGFDTTLRGFINATPLPNNFTVGDGLNTAGFNWGSPQHEKQYDFVMKFDYTMNQKNAIYVRYARGRQNTLGDSANGGRPIFPGSPNFVNTYRSPDNTAINWRWSPTANVTNEFIFGVSRFFFKFLTPTPDSNLPFAFINVATPNTNFSYNARGVRTLQYIDNITYIHGSHTFKGGSNFRFNHHTDDRSSVAGSAIEPIVNLGNPAGFSGFGLPASGSTGINSTDLTRLQNTIIDLQGRVNTVSQAFVTDPNSPTTFLSAGSRWINEANYPELDFYFQDNWRLRSNFVLDLGLRWEAKLNPSLDTRNVLVPNQAVKLGAAPSNTLRWVPGDLFQNDYSKFLPSVGFAWDPFKTGKTSIRGNYRIASDRIATFLFGSSIFQSTPGNNSAVTNSAFGQSGGLYRNIAPIIAGLVPTATPDALRQPPAISNNSLSVIDPDLQFPQVHEWALSFQREVWKNNVIEVNYIGKHAVHLLGGYDANQVNIFAGVSGISENFLSAFNSIKTSSSYQSPLINRLLTGNAANNAGTTTFRSIASASIANGSVATAAQTVSQRLCQSSDVSGGFCTATGLQLLSQTIANPFLFQTYPQFTGALNVFDSSDFSNYKAVEVIFRRRLSGGLSYQAAYTLSLSKDNRSWDPSLSTVSRGSVQSASSTPFDNRDRKLNYTWSDFDRRHIFQGTWVYELPLGKGRRWLNSNALVDHVIGGWQVSGTMISASGRPFTVYSGINTLSNVVQSPADCNGCSRHIGQLVLETGRNFWFDSTARAKFSQPVPGTIGNTGRNFFIAPVYNQMDLGLLKKFRITERITFDLRADIKNLTNHPSFDNPTAVLTSTIFGRINDSVTNTARRIQVGGKLYF